MTFSSLRLLPTRAVASRPAASPPTPMTRIAAEANVPRKFLELILAPLSAETAEVTLLGHIEDGLPALQALGARLRERHGEDDGEDRER